MEDKNLQEWKAKASAVLDDIKNQVEGSDVATEVRSQMARILGEVKKMEKEQQEALSEVTDQLHQKVMEFMTSDLALMEKEARARIAAAMDEQQLHEARVAFLGKKGRLTAVLRSMKDLSAEERPKMGALANKVRNEIEELEGQKKEEIKARMLNARIESEKIDITLPSRQMRKGHIHPLNKALREIVKSFTRMGYSVEEGPEIESDYYNFSCLNLPKDHPVARDMQDSFYITRISFSVPRHLRFRRGPCRNIDKFQSA